MFVCIFTVFALFWLVLELLGIHTGMHTCILFIVFALFWVVLGLLGIHTGMHICMLFSVFALFWACLCRALECIVMCYLRCLRSFGLVSEGLGMHSYTEFTVFARFCADFYDVCIFMCFLSITAYGT
jgi:hypothetical protein